MSNTLPGRWGIPTFDDIEVKYPVLNKSTEHDFGEIAGSNINYFIDSVSGDDIAGYGTQVAPFKTLSRAFEVTPMFWNGVFVFKIINNIYTVGGVESIIPTGLGKIAPDQPLRYYIRGATGDLAINRDLSLADGIDTALSFPSYGKTSHNVVSFSNVTITDVRIIRTGLLDITWSGNSSWAIHKLTNSVSYFDYPVLVGNMQFYKKSLGDTITLSIDVTGMNISSTYRKGLIQCQGLSMPMAYAWTGGKIIVAISDNTIQIPALTASGNNTYRDLDLVFSNGGGIFEIQNAYIGVLVGGHGIGSDPNYIASKNSMKLINARFGSSLALTNCNTGIHVRRNINFLGDWLGSTPIFSGCTTNWILDSGASSEPSTTF